MQWGLILAIGLGILLGHIFNRIFDKLLPPG